MAPLDLSGVFHKYPKKLLITALGFVKRVNTHRLLSEPLSVCVLYEFKLMSIRNWEVHLEIGGQHLDSFKVSKPQDIADKLSLNDLQFCDRITLVPVKLPRD